MNASPPSTTLSSTRLWLPKPLPHRRQQLVRLGPPPNHLSKAIDCASGGLALPENTISASSVSDGGMPFMLLLPVVGRLNQSSDNATLFNFGWRGRMIQGLRPSPLRGRLRRSTSRPNRSPSRALPPKRWGSGSGRRALPSSRRDRSFSKRSSATWPRRIIL